MPKSSFNKSLFDSKHELIGGKFNQVGSISATDLPQFNCGIKTAYVDFSRYGNKQMRIILNTGYQPKPIVLDTDSNLLLHDEVDPSSIVIKQYDRVNADGTLDTTYRADGTAIITDDDEE